MQMKFAYDSFGWNKSDVGIYNIHTAVIKNTETNKETQK